MGHAPEAVEQTEAKEPCTPVSRGFSSLSVSHLNPSRARKAGLTLRITGNPYQGALPVSPACLRQTYLSLLLQLCPSLPLFAIGFTVNEVRLAVKFACKKRHTHTEKFFSCKLEPQ